MSNRVKGITVEIGGDVTGLNKALSGVNQKIRNTQSNLKDVERLLKLDPTNTELLRQKQQLLAQATEQTKNKLKGLKEISASVTADNAKYEQWKEAFTPIQGQITKTENELVRLQKKQKELEQGGEIDTSQYQKVQAEAEKLKDKLEKLRKKKVQTFEEFGNPVSTEQYDKVQREIAETTLELKNAEKQAKETNSALSKISTAAGKVSEKTGKIASAMTPATVAITGLGAAAVKAASDQEESLNKVEVAFGFSADKVKEFSETTLESYGISKGTALDMASLFGDMATSMGLPKNEAADLSMSLVGLAGDLASFKNVSLETAETALKGIFTGETESLKNLGIVMTQTNLDAYALANGFGKTTKEMTESEKVMLRYAYVMDSSKNAQGDYARTSDGTANSLRGLQESVKELAAEFGEVLLPVITPIIQKITEAVKWFGNLDEGQQKLIITIAALVAAIGPVSGIISGVSKAVSGLSSVMSLLGVSTGPIGAVITIVGALVSAFLYLWNTSDEFRQFFIDMGDSIASAFEAVGDFFVSLFTEKIPDALQKMKDFFKKIWDALVDIVKAPINAIIEFINMFIGGINSIIEGINSIKIDIPDWIPDWLGGGQTIGFNIPTIPEIPLLAKGGIITQGSAIVGEEGPEFLTVTSGRAIVQPLNNGNTQNIANNTSSAQNIYINVNGIEQLDEIVNWYTNRQQMARAR